MTDPRSTPPAPPRVSRRTFLASAGAGTAALAVAGCGATRRSPARATTGGQVTAEVTRAPFHSRPDLRPPAVEIARRPAHPGSDVFVFTDAHAGSGQQGPMIIDRAGGLRWFQPVSDDGSTRRRVMNVRVQRYRGEPVLSYWVGGLVASHGAGHYEIYDQSYRLLTTVTAVGDIEGDLHEFVITPAGTALFTAYGRATGQIPSPDGDGTRLADYWYCCCQEVDIASGKLLMQWRSDEHVPFSASRLSPTPTHATTPWDYFHMNSINVDPSDGNLIISSRNTWQIYKVQRHTGATLWRLGGTGSDFEMGPRTPFAFQHHVTPHGGGVYTIFDNEGGPPDLAAQSRGLVLQVDETGREVTFVREYHHDPAVLSDALGSVQELSGGRMFVGWGTSSWFTEWGRDGEIVLDGRLGDGVISYRAFEAAWQGVPATPPTFALRRSGAGGTVYVSWNGATIHRSWRVLGGGGGTDMQPLARADVTGFETAIPLDAVPGVLMVEAIDERGEVAARSDALRIS